MIERMSFNKRQKLEILLLALLGICSIGGFFSISDGQPAALEGTSDVPRAGTKKTGTVGRIGIAGADLARETGDLHDPFSMGHETREQAVQKVQAPAAQDPPVQQGDAGVPQQNPDQPRSGRARASRGNTVPEAEPAVEEASPVLPSLKGVVSGGSVPVAILEMDGQQKVVLTGDWLGDWHILSISDAGVELEADGNSFWLSVP